MINNKLKTEFVNCPFCHGDKYSTWASENGFTAVKCSACGMVYVNPRPIMTLIQEAVKTGVHSEVVHGRTSINRRVIVKVIRYKKILASIFEDIWKTNHNISWLDVGAGYGEIVEAVSLLASPGSKIEGIEPMKPKACDAQKRGLCIREAYLNEMDVQDKFDYVSIINVFSHIPDFRDFLKDVKNILADHGEIFIETGNAGDIKNSKDVCNELDLPDHLVFAGEKHIIEYLSEAGFSVIKMIKLRNDGLISFSKNIVKKLLGRNIYLTLPYTSQYRSILIRAKLI